MTPAGTSNELDVQNGWEENTHTHILYQAYKIFYRSRGDCLAVWFLLAKTFYKFLCSVSHLQKSVFGQFQIYGCLGSFVMGTEIKFCGLQYITVQYSILYFMSLCITARTQKIPAQSAVQNLEIFVLGSIFVFL